MTLDQEQAIRKTFRDHGLPDYVGMELTAAIPFLIALLDQQKREGIEFPNECFHIRLGDNRYRLLFEED